MAENTRLKRWYEGYGFRETAVKKYPHLPFTVCEMDREA
jgi:ribosomal protein S18 acetylase RimI-like enzyme